MIKFNLLRIFRKPATPRQIVLTCITVFLFLCAAVLLLFGVISIIEYLTFAELVNIIIGVIIFCIGFWIIFLFFSKVTNRILE